MRNFLFLIGGIICCIDVLVKFSISEMFRFFHKEDQILQKSWLSAQGISRSNCIAFFKAGERIVQFT